MRVGAREAFAYQSVKLVLLANGERYAVDFNKFCQVMSYIYLKYCPVPLSQLSPLLTHIRTCSLWLYGQRYWVMLNADFILQTYPQAPTTAGKSANGLKQDIFDLLGLRRIRYSPRGRFRRREYSSTSLSFRQGPLRRSLNSWRICCSLVFPVFPSMTSWTSSW
jgi:hypothetical protein